MLPRSLRSLVKFGIITQVEARHFPTKLLCSNFCSAPSETGVFWSLCAEEGLSHPEVLLLWRCWAWLTGVHLKEKHFPWDQKIGI